MVCSKTGKIIQNTADKGLNHDLRICKLGERFPLKTVWEKVFV